ncbi:DNA polymerase III subunit epsilon [Dasania marina]|uniref:DNA polymerase III subunit epsilon n=1 Tax=Dasania marina TaxID=471499 RepID=UPI0030D7125F|tara:strand:+ start:13452 stop:14159 length:708 start_codon:yes stop_codon:yes gene_type:complete
MRQVVLDTETTGLEHREGHRVIEIGCVELVDRKLTGRHYHQYINPNRDIEQEAIGIHGITNEFLVDKPLFSHIADDFLAFVKGAELVIHNAPFDMGFLNNELALHDKKLGRLEQYCGVLDTLALARKKHPGQRNTLDALCSRYGVDNSQRDLHGALLDSEILADVYLLITGGQTNLLLADSDNNQQGEAVAELRPVQADREPLKVIKASTEELVLHEQRLDEVEKKSESGCLWRS